jgi:hypothetical protein
MSFLPVCAEGTEATEPSSPQEMVQIEDPDIAPVEDTEDEMTDLSDGQDAPNEYFIDLMQNLAEGTQEIALRDKAGAKLNASYSICSMSDLVGVLGASNVSVVSDTEIKLVKDISIERPDDAYCHFYGTFIIDFNGHSLTGIVCLQSDEGSNLTLKDSTGTNTGGIISIPGRNDNGDPTFSLLPAVCQGGKLTIESGHYSGFGDSILAMEGELRIDGGIIKPGCDGANGTWAALEIFSSMEKAEINGGQFYADLFAVYCSKDWFAQREISMPNPLRISGGSFSIKGIDSEYGAITYVDGESDEIPDINELIADNCCIVPGNIYEHHDSRYGDAYAYTGPKVEVTADTGVRDFVTRLYTKVLNRDPDEAGYTNWVNQLKSRKISGSEVAYGFFFSKELTKRNLSNEEFVTLLYNTFFDRAPDEGGMKTWLTSLETGASRKYVFSGFANSKEWKGLCASYGIEPGSYKSDEPRDQNLKVTAFVQRLYTLCLNRGADVEGLNNWTKALNSQTQDGAHVAYGFFFSKEFLGRNLSNADYVEVLYKVLLGRGSDPAGKADWVKKLDGGTGRMDVFRGFVHSQEFDKICADYGIVRGTI